MFTLFFFCILQLVFSEDVHIGAVSCSNAQASNVGREILKQGGNAFDAVVAMTYAIGVVEPSASGVGGGGFATLYDASSQQVVTIDGREEAPAAFHPNIWCEDVECYENAECDCTNRIGWSSRIVGGLSVGVPGMVAMTRKILEEYGTMTLAEVIAPAIELAENGFLASENLIENAGHDRWWFSHLQYQTETRQLWLNDDGSSFKYAPGETIRNPDLANTLRLIAEDPDTMYSGDLAQEIINTIQQNPNPASGRVGLLTLDDMINYDAVRREPLSWSFGEYQMFGHPMPTSGPATIAMVTKMMKELRGSEAESENAFDDPEFIHHFISAQNLAWSDRNKYMADADFVDVPVSGLLSDEYNHARASTVGESMLAAQHGSPSENPDNTGTSNLVVMDKDGNIASIVSTIEFYFGSALTVPGRGFFLNNQLTDFEGSGYDSEGNLKANAPEGGKKNRRTAILGDEITSGSKRPRSSTSPIIVLKSGQPYAAIGGTGGSTIIGSTMNTLFRMIFEGRDAREAVNLPRCWARGGTADLEEELYDIVSAPMIADRGYELNRRDYYPQTYKRQSMAVQFDSESGTFSVGYEERRNPSAMGFIVTDTTTDDEDVFTTTAELQECPEGTVSLGSGICSCLNNSANQQYLPEDSSFCTPSPTTTISSIIEESTETPNQNTTKGAGSEEDTTDMPVSSFTTPGAESEEEETTEGAESEEETTEGAESEEETTEGAESEEETTQGAESEEEEETTEGAESEEETTISPDLKGVCTEEQNMELLAALEAATTSECRTLVAIMNSDDDEEATDAQICDCLSSGHDFSALSGFDCKVSEDATQNVSVFVSGGGVCSSDSIPAKQVKFSMTVSMTLDTFNTKKEEVKEGIAKSLNVHKDDVEVAVIEAAESRLRRMLSNIELEVTVLTDDEDTIIDTVTANNFADTLSSNISESTDEDVVATGVSEPIVSINPAAPSPVVTTSESDDEIGGGKWALIVICILTTLAIAAFFTWFCYYQDPKSKAKPELEMGNPSSI